MIVKMIQNLGNRMDKIQETFNKDLEEIKSKQTMMKNTINEIKNSLEGINRRITEGEEQISDLEDRMVEITAMEKNKQTEMNNTITEMKNILEEIKIGRASCRERV